MSRHLSKTDLYACMQSPLMLESLRRIMIRKEAILMDGRRIGLCSVPQAVKLFVRL